jgi:hypothetical protein
MGLLFILGGNDFSFMMSAAHARAQQLRGKRIGPPPGE